VARFDAKAERDLARRMIEQFLQNSSRATGQSAFNFASLDEAAPHIDEDALAAFTEGRLTQTEAAPIVSHLVACASCRQMVAALLRLEGEFVFDDTPARQSANAEEHGRLRRFFDQLAERLAPFTSEQTVFAYQEDTSSDTSDASDEDKGKESKKR
jgi:hypothetical protein